MWIITTQNMEEINKEDNEERTTSITAMYADNEEEK